MVNETKAFSYIYTYYTYIFISYFLLLIIEYLVY